MKRVLVTAGPVYGPLDANKLVSNRVRGLWATQFALYLAKRGHHVTLLIADIMDKDGMAEFFGQHLSEITGKVQIKLHKGFWGYQEKCLEHAITHDAAIMAGAVVNWIPAEPYEGKMPTKGFKEGDIIQVPFVLAPHVIDQMKVANPKLTLIGCKMLVNASEEDLIEAAYGVLLKAKCNAVVANDMGKGLRRKLVVHQDRTVMEYNGDFEGFYANLLGHIEDEHYHTVRMSAFWLRTEEKTDAIQTFDAVVERYRGRFTHRSSGPEGDRVFGAVCVHVPDGIGGTQGWLLSPREKGTMFTSQDATLVRKIKWEDRALMVDGPKATLNAPLMIRVAQQYPNAKTILHMHEQLRGFPTVPHAPPGTVRDNERDIPGPVFNIEGHGFIACLDHNLDIWKVA